MNYRHLQLNSSAHENHFHADEHEFSYACFHLHLQMIPMPMEMIPTAHESRFHAEKKEASCQNDDADEFVCS